MTVTSIMQLAMENVFKILIILNLLGSFSYAMFNSVGEEGLGAHISKNSTSVTISPVIELQEPQSLNSIKLKPNKIDPQQFLSVLNFKKETLAIEDIGKIIENAHELIPQFNDEDYKLQGQFIISDPLQPIDESAWPGNLPDLEERCAVEFNDGLLYQHGQILNSDEEGLWALNPQGKLCIYFSKKHPDIPHAVHHSFFFKEHGIGQTIACAGIIKVCRGKSTRIDNDSGRYQPIDPQLLLSVKYLHSKNVLDPEITISTVREDRNISLEEALVIAYSMELSS